MGRRWLIRNKGERLFWSMINYVTVQTRFLNRCFSKFFWKFPNTYEPFNNLLLSFPSILYEKKGGRCTRLEQKVTDSRGTLKLVSEGVFMVNSLWSEYRHQMILKKTTIHEDEGIRVSFIDFIFIIINIHLPNTRIIMNIICSSII